MVMYSIFWRHLTVSNCVFVHLRNVTSRYQYQERSAAVGLDDCGTEADVFTEDGDESNEMEHSLGTAFDDVTDEAAICVQSSSDERISFSSLPTLISSSFCAQEPFCWRQSIVAPSSQLENKLHIGVQFNV